MFKVYFINRIETWSQLLSAVVLPENLFQLVVNNKYNKKN